MSPLNVGVLGAGQLGRMLAEAGMEMGMDFRFLDPGERVSAARHGDHRRAGYDDTLALQHFAEDLDVVTYEFENVPEQSARLLQEHLPVYPPPMALRVAQDRLSEKTFFSDLGVPVPGFVPVDSAEELKSAAERLGFPLVLKTRRGGYDGKGQAVVHDDEEAAAALAELGGKPVIAEQLVRFDREVSLLAVRSRSGDVVAYPLIENHHREGILRLSISPAANISAEVQRTAETYAMKALEELDYVGVLAIEFFQVDQDLYVNEMAPRVHNSGHATIEGAQTSQFANHLRAVAGMELGRGDAKGFSAMINVIGSWPDVVTLGRFLFVHDYEKGARPGRKIGHLTCTEVTREALRTKVELLTRMTEIPHLTDVLEAGHWH